MIPPGRRNLLSVSYSIQRTPFDPSRYLPCQAQPLARGRIHRVGAKQSTSKEEACSSLLPQRIEMWVPTHTLLGV